MDITINNHTYEVPFDLMNISLADFLDYQEQYGKALEKELETLKQKQYTDELEEINEFERQLDIDSHIDNEALAWVSYWTKHDLTDAREVPGITDVLVMYRIFQQGIKQQEEDLQDFPLEFEWNGDAWSIEDYRLNPFSEMTFNEVVTSKEIMRQMHLLERGRWDGLPYLCAIFLRKKGEPFSDVLVREGGERMELFKKLPLKYALQVAFFLTCSVILWAKTLASSAEEAKVSRNSISSTRTGGSFRSLQASLKQASSIYPGVGKMRSRVRKKQKPTRS